MKINLISRRCGILLIAYIALLIKNAHYNKRGYDLKTERQLSILELCKPTLYI